MSHGLPYTWVATIADVLDVMAASARSALSVSASGSTSAKTGEHLSHAMLDVVATYEKGDVITSPARSSARNASCNAIVPLLTNRQCFTPRYSARRCSSSTTSGPAFVRWFRAHTPSSSATYSSSGGSVGRLTAIGFGATFIAPGSVVGFDGALTTPPSGSGAGVARTLRRPAADGTRGTSARATADAPVIPAARGTRRGSRAGRPAVADRSGRAASTPGRPIAHRAGPLAA